MTQAELAKAMDPVSHESPGFERGDPTASLDLLLKALMALGMSNKQISKLME